MSTETKTERVLRDVLNGDNLRDLLGEDAVNNAMKWRFLQAALYVLDGHGLLGDPDAVKDATPAPLDPAKVKAGDTVTLLGTKAKIEGEVEDVQKDTDALVIIQIDNLRFRVTGDDAWTLTAHQPAPEPEPEFRSRFVTGQVNGTTVDGFTDQDGDFYGLEDGFLRAHHIDQMTDVRPLVVIDPAAVDVDALAAAIRKAEETGGPFTATTKRLAYAALAHLGIEATS